MASFNLNDFVTFIGTPTNIVWTYGTCDTPSGTPVAGQPSLTDTALGTIDSSTGTAGTYNYNVNYVDSTGTGCTDFCINLQVTIADSITVEFIETDDGYLDVGAGSCTGEFYHICDFGSPSAGGDLGDLTFDFEFLDGPDGSSEPADTTGSLEVDVTVNGVSIAGFPITTGITALPSGNTDGTYEVSDTSGRFTLTPANIAAIRALAVGHDIAEVQFTVTLTPDSDDINCVNETTINVLISPEIDTDEGVLDCGTVVDPALFDLYDWILNIGDGNTAPGALTGGACSETDSPNEQGGWHYWHLKDVDSELYTLISNNLPACDGTTFSDCIIDNGNASDGFFILSPLTGGNEMLLDIASMATAGSHEFTLNHVVEFFHQGTPSAPENVNVYTCTSADLTLDVDTTDCCTVNESSADPVTLCN